MESLEEIAEKRTIASQASRGMVASSSKNGCDREN
jgi:hypothetical protein